MSATSLDAIGVIVGLLASIVTTVLLIRSSTRETLRQRQEAIDKAITEAKAPLILENTQLTSKVDQLTSDQQRRDDVHRAEIDRKDARITELEDRLYGRGSGR